MNDDLINDLKQFITMAIAQQTVDLREEISEVEQRLTKKIDDLSRFVGEALHTSNEATASQLSDHEHRLTRLEARAA